MAGRKHELMEAVRHGSPELVKALVLTGADIDECGPEALWNAISAERPEILDTLISLGANVMENKSTDIYRGWKDAKDCSNINLLESYVLRKINVSNIKELSSDSLAVAAVLIRNGLSLRSDDELIQMTLGQPLKTEIIEKRIMVIEQVRNIEKRHNTLEQEDDMSCYRGTEIDFNI